MEKRNNLPYAGALLSFDMKRVFLHRASDDDNGI
jgi:hypothetical protein